MTKKKVPAFTNEKVEKYLEDAREAIKKAKKEQQRMKAEADRERKNRLFKHGTHMEAIFGEAESEDMLILILTMLEKLKENNVNDFAENELERKIKMIGKLTKSHQAQIGFLRDEAEKVKKQDLKIEFFKTVNETEEEPFEQNHFRVLKKEKNGDYKVRIIEKEDKKKKNASSNKTESTEEQNDNVVIENESNEIEENN